MRLRIITPEREVARARALTLRAIGLDGAFGVRPRHLDLVAPLVAGVASFDDDAGQERYVAVDQGTLLKIGDEVTIAVHRAVVGDDLERLAKLVDEEFTSASEHERKGKRALSRLEAGIIRRFLELEEQR